MIFILADDFEWNMFDILILFFISEICLWGWALSSRYNDEGLVMFFVGTFTDECHLVDYSVLSRVIGTP
jgi:hypothetical protein